MDLELARKNVRLGWLLFGVFVIIFVGCILIGVLFVHYQ